ncbi:phage major capsid protein [Acidobacteria bacterium AH-259-A15]|nr:phage major capsid protein [Acidobacteria bacterium AH-259-A15]
MNDKKRSFALCFGCSPFKLASHQPLSGMAFAFPLMAILLLVGLFVFSDQFDQLTYGFFLVGGMEELTEKRQELKAKSDVLAAVFQTCGTADGKQLDLSKLKKFGEEDVSSKTSVEKAEMINKANLELTEIGKDINSLEGALKAQQNVTSLNEPRSPMIHPSPGGGFSRAIDIKSLGQMVAQSESYASHFTQRKEKGGLTFNFDEVFPSDLMISKNAEGLRYFFNTLFETTAGWPPESIRLPGFVEAVTRPVQVLDIIPMGRTGNEAIKYMEETTRTHAAAEKAEGAAFAESTFVFTEKSSNVEKITDSVPVTDEQLEDVNQVESYLNGRVTFGLRQRLDSQVINGDGIAPNLKGILNVAGIQTQAKGADPTPDTVYKGITKILVTGRAIATHIIMHPNDWQQIRLLRTADGIYIWGSPADAGPERIWGLPLVKADLIAEGTGLVGSFQSAWISLFERRGVDVQVGYTGTQFVQGKRTIRADMRFGFVVFRPAAFASLTGI